jgi:hypothetical protein
LALHSLPPGRQLCPMWGRSIAFAMMVALSSPPLPSQGHLPVAGRRALVAGKGRRLAAMPMWGAIQTAPSRQQRFRSCVKCHCVLARMGIFVFWQGGGFGNDGGVVDVFELMTARAGGKRLGKSGRGKEEDVLTRQWQCCHARGGWWMAP